MEQTPLDTARQILIAREEYGKQLEQANAPTQFNQSQMTFGQQGSFLSGIQYRQAVKAEKEHFKRDVTAAKDIFETSVAKAAPEYGEVGYVEKEYGGVQSKLKTQLEGVEKQIKAVEEKAAMPGNTSQEKKEYNREIEVLKQRARGYSEGLGMSKYEAIKAGQGDYFDRLSDAYARQQKERYRVADINAEKKVEFYKEHPEALAYSKDQKAWNENYGKLQEAYYNKGLDKLQRWNNVTPETLNALTKESNKYILDYAGKQGVTLQIATKPSGTPTIEGGTTAVKVVYDVKDKATPVGVVTTVLPTFNVWENGYREFTNLGTSNIQIGNVTEIGKQAEKDIGAMGTLDLKTNTFITDKGEKVKDVLETGGYFDTNTNTFIDVGGATTKLTTSEPSKPTISAEVSKITTPTVTSDLKQVDRAFWALQGPTTTALAQIGAPILFGGAKVVAGGYDIFNKMVGAGVQKVWDYGIKPVGLSFIETPVIATGVLAQAGQAAWEPIIKPNIEAASSQTKEDLGRISFIGTEFAEHVGKPIISNIAQSGRIVTDIVTDVGKAGVQYIGKPVVSNVIDTSLLLGGTGLALGGVTNKLVETGAEKSWQFIGKPLTSNIVQSGKIVVDIAGDITKKIGGNIIKPTVQNIIETPMVIGAVSAGVTKAGFEGFTTGVGTVGQAAYQGFTGTFKDLSAINQKASEKIYDFYNTRNIDITKPIQFTIGRTPSDEITRVGKFSEGSTKTIAIEKNTGELGIILRDQVKTQGQDPFAAIFTGTRNLEDHTIMLRNGSWYDMGLEKDFRQLSVNEQKNTMGKLLPAYQQDVLNQSQIKTDKKTGLTITIPTPFSKAADVTKNVATGTKIASQFLLPITAKATADTTLSFFKIKKDVEGLKSDILSTGTKIIGGAIGGKYVLQAFAPKIAKDVLMPDKREISSTQELGGAKVTYVKDRTKDWQSNEYVQKLVDGNVVETMSQDEYTKRRDAELNAQKFSGGTFGSAGATDLGIGVQKIKEGLRLQSYEESLGRLLGSEGVTGYTIPGKFGTAFEKVIEYKEGMSQYRDKEGKQVLQATPLEFLKTGEAFRALPTPEEKVAREEFLKRGVRNIESAGIWGSTFLTGGYPVIPSIIYTPSLISRTVQQGPISTYQKYSPEIIGLASLGVGTRFGLIGPKSMAWIAGTETGYAKDIANVLKTSGQTFDEAELQKRMLTPEYTSAKEVYDLDFKEKYQPKIDKDFESYREKVTSGQMTEEEAQKKYFESPEYQSYVKEFNATDKGKKDSTEVVKALGPGTWKGAIIERAANLLTPSTAAQFTILWPGAYAGVETLSGIPLLGKVAKTTLALAPVGFLAEGAKNIFTGTTRKTQIAGVEEAIFGAIGTYHQLAPIVKGQYAKWYGEKVKTYDVEKKDTESRRILEKEIKEISPKSNLIYAIKLSGEKISFDKPADIIKIVNAAGEVTKTPEISRTIPGGKVEITPDLILLPELPKVGGISNPVAQFARIEIPKGPTIVFYTDPEVPRLDKLIADRFLEASYITPKRTINEKVTDILSTITILKDKNAELLPSREKTIPEEFSILQLSPKPIESKIELREGIIPTTKYVELPTSTGEKTPFVFVPSRQVLSTWKALGGEKGFVELTPEAKSILSEAGYPKWLLKLQDYMRIKFPRRELIEPRRSPTEILTSQKYGDVIVEILQKNNNLRLFGKQAENFYTPKIAETKDFDTMTTNRDAEADAKLAQAIFKEHGIDASAKPLMYTDKKTGEKKQAHGTWQILVNGKIIQEITPTGYNIPLNTVKIEGMNIIPVDEMIKAKAFVLINEDMGFRKRWEKDALSLQRLTEGAIQAKDLIYKQKYERPLTAYGATTKEQAEMLGRTVTTTSSSIRFFNTLGSKTAIISKPESKGVEAFFFTNPPYFKGEYKGIPMIRESRLFLKEGVRGQLVNIREKPTLLVEYNKMIENIPAEIKPQYDAWVKSGMKRTGKEFIKFNKDYIEYQKTKPGKAFIEFYSSEWQAASSEGTLIKRVPLTGYTKVLSEVGYQKPDAIFALKPEGQTFEKKVDVFIVESSPPKTSSEKADVKKISAIRELINQGKIGGKEGTPEEIAKIQESLTQTDAKNIIEKLNPNKKISSEQITAEDAISEIKGFLNQLSSKYKVDYFRVMGLSKVTKGLGRGEVIRVASKVMPYTTITSSTITQIPSPRIELIKEEAKMSSEIRTSRLPESQRIGIYREIREPRELQKPDIRINREIREVRIPEERALREQRELKTPEERTPRELRPTREPRPPRIPEERIPREPQVPRVPMEPQIPRTPFIRTSDKTLREEKALKKKAKPGYEVFVRRKKIFRKESPFPLSREEAISFGARRALTSAAATFQLRASKEEAKSAGLPSIGEINRFFRRPLARSKLNAPDTFIQLERKRIQSAGEKREISFAGIAARGRKSTAFTPKKSSTSFIKSNKLKYGKRTFF